MRLSVKQQRNIRRGLIITFIWIIFNLWLSVYNHVIVSDNLFSLGHTEQYNFGLSVVANIVASVLAGFLGLPTLLYVDQKLRKKSFTASIIAVAVTFIIAYYLISFLVGLGYNSVITESPIFSSIVLEKVFIFLTKPIFLISGITWFILVLATQFMLRANQVFGEGVLWKFIRGKYHSPREEDRIFMFLDLTGSTGIAERIGNRRYFHLLSDFFFDISGPIINSKGEIYQYVGDEIVVSWESQKGIIDANCIRCFFDIQRLIDDQAARYEEEYGLRPEFKAGLHMGNVTVGELGESKREIVFSGDILNTTARIRSECSNYDVNFLVSKDLLNSVSLNGEFNDRDIGEIRLRGKKKTVGLSTVELK